MHDTGFYGPLIAIVLLALPFILGTMSWITSRRDERGPTLPSPFLVVSLLTYVLAFNLTFFIQELFLVLPKAIAGLQPILYHNNHDWMVDAPIADLLQGTGSWAILLVGLVCAILAARGTGRTEASRLIIFWMAFNGLFQGLPQWAFAPMAPTSDTGRALSYLDPGAVGGTLIGLAAVAAMIGAGILLTKALLQMAPHDAVKTGRGRLMFVAKAAFAPALMAVPILILFRIPREWNEVVAPTIALPLFGLIWFWASAAGVDVAARPASPSANVTLLAGANIALLIVFQLVLRPGVRFY
jgi:hypothetical protein